MDDRDVIGLSLKGKPRKRLVFETAQDWLEHYALPVTESGCWLFRGHVSEFGYGIITLGKGKTKQHLSSYRESWQRFYGDIPAGMDVCHRCDVRLCLNPKHLFLGTRADNTRDMLRKGRQGNQRKILCMRGHELTPAHGGKGRVCETCKREAAKLWARKKRASAKTLAQVLHS